MKTGVLSSRAVFPSTLSALLVLGLAGCQSTEEAPDEARRHLAFLAKTPGRPDYGQLRFDPAWAARRGRPDFQAMLAAIDPHLGP